MSIVQAQAIPVRLPFDIGGPKPTFAGIPRMMDILFIRIETDTGLVGWGEAFGLSVWPATRQAFEHLVVPLILGKDEKNIHELMLSLHQQLHILGRTGAVTYALSGLDIALWDLAGKASQQSISELLGGKRHTTLPAYASLMRYGNPNLVQRNTERALQQGFSAIKLHELGVEHVQAARSVMGMDIPLMMDVNCPWSLEQTQQMITELEASNLYWLEEPIWPPEDFTNLANVRQLKKIPIAAGENNMSTHHFAEMLKLGAVDFAQPSVTKIGGITEMMKIIDLCKDHAIPVMPHSPYFGPGLLATLHMTACFEELTMIEYSFADLGGNPFGDSILLKNGVLEVPTGPGLGYEPDLDVIAEFRVP
jgi:L-alanine-DL-glutamate epimerase-like enolase superfamily enzyme